MTDYIPTIALSHSRASDFEQCRLKFKAKYIDKDYPDDSNNPAFVKGNQVHGQCEDYINWVINDRPSEEEPVMGGIANAAVPMIEKLWKISNGNLHSEKQVAVNQNWEKCTWFDPPSVVKYRVIADALAFVDDTLIVIDWKTGKVRPYEDGPRTQLKLTAAVFMKLYPKIKNVICNYMFLEHKETIRQQFDRSMLDGIVKEYDLYHKIVNEETDFPHKKNRYCNWCLYEKCPIKSD